MDYVVKMGSWDEFISLILIEMRFNKNTQVEVETINNLTLDQPLPIVPIKIFKQINT